MKPQVSIIMGSISDMPVMEKAKEILNKFNIPYEIKILSAHRSPADTSIYAKKASKRGIKVIIAGAGGAAHLPGVIASYTNLPVIGVPIHTKSFKGIDSVLSILQMPSGVPVAAMAVGEAGAKNAAVLAMEILALKNSKLTKKLVLHKKELVTKVRKSNVSSHKG